jgi:class 3 adenylate cyclase
LKSVSLSREDLARAVRVDVGAVEELLEWGFLKPDSEGRFRPSDIQRVRAVMAMRSPGITLDQLVAAFRERMFTLQPMDQLYPVPAVVTDTTPADLGAELALSEQEVIRLMTAVGFPAPVAGMPMREDDIRLLRELVAGGRALGGEQHIYRFARTYGDAARRAAESGVAMFSQNVNSPVVEARVDDAQREAVNELAGQLMRSSEVLLGELYRRHLEHTLMRLWAVTAETFLDQLGVRPARPEVHGLAFVDLTGYTALTEQGGDATAVRLAERLAELAEAAAASHGGRVVKLLGDGAMLHFDDELDAVRGALTLVESIAGSDLPAAHAGVHAGSVIERDGDYFGATVNLAARIAAQAEAGQVLTSGAVAVQGASDLVFEPLGARTLKGVGTAELYLVRQA